MIKARVTPPENIERFTEWLYLRYQGKIKNKEDFDKIFDYELEPIESGEQDSTFRDKVWNKFKEKYNISSDSKSSSSSINKPKNNKVMNELALRKNNDGTITRVYAYEDSVEIKGNKRKTHRDSLGKFVSKTRDREAYQNKFKNKKDGN